MKTKIRTITASEYCENVADGTHDSPKQTETGKYMITSRHLGEYELDFANAYRISVDDYEKVIARSKVEQWDILFSMIGTIGRVYQETNERTDYAIKNVGLFRLGGNKQKSDWLKYFLKSPKAQEYINSRLRGSTQGYIPLGALRDMPIDVPTSTVQHAITATLSALDDKIALNTKINRNLEQMAQAIFKSWFVDFEPWGGIMPERWRIEKLGNLCQSISKTHSFDKENLIFLNTSDIDSGLFLHSDYSPVRDMPGQAKKSIEKGDILYSEIRPINRHFAFVNFDSPDYVVSTKLMVIRAKEIDSRRLYHYLTSDDVIAELQLEAESRSGTFPQIRFENIQNKDILLATSDSEQTFTSLYNVVRFLRIPLNLDNRSQ